MLANILLTREAPMELNRREFVATAAGALLAGAASRTASTQEAPAGVAANYADWSAVKAQFDLAPQWLHFSQFYIVSHPRPVRAAIERSRRMLDANPFHTVEHGMGFEAFLAGTQEESLPTRVQRAAADYVGGR